MPYSSTGMLFYANWVRWLLVEKISLVVFSERELHVRYLLSPVRLSSVCLSYVTFVRPTQAIQIFGNISTALGTLAIRWHPLKISRRSGSFRAHCVKVHVRYLISWWVLVFLWYHGSCLLSSQSSPPPRPSVVTSRFRSSQTFPKVHTRTKRYCSFIRRGLKLLPAQNQINLVFLLLLTFNVWFHYFLFRLL